MAIPTIKEAVLATPHTLVLYFDSPLDTKVPVPTICFTVNYGQHQVETIVYSSDTMVSIGIDCPLTPWDQVFVTYEPPLDLNSCLRGAIPAGSNDTIKKRNAVRSFSRFPVKNTLVPDEDKSNSRANSNLGESIGGIGYPFQNRSSDPKTASPDDFILAYGLKEAIQLTNIDDGSATSVNVAKLRMAIEDANALIDSYIQQSGKAGKVLISSNRRRTALIIARYYLDTIRRREDVYKDYVDALKQLDAEREMTAIRAGNGDSAIDTKRGIMRSWRIPQRYNSVSGKGLSGWSTDTGGDQASDYRVGFGATGQNNINANWIGPRDYEDLSNGSSITTPNDHGGYFVNGSDTTFP